MLQVGDTYKDMTVINIEGDRVTRKCNICGKELVSSRSAVSRGVGFTHLRACKPQALKVGDTYKDMTIIDHREGKFLVHCNICSKQRWLSSGNVSQKVGFTHSGGCNRKSTARTAEEERFWRVYSSIKERCNSPSCAKYKNYGGRGIRCEWELFMDFKRDMWDSYLVALTRLERPSIERIDVNGNYSKSNCKWIELSEQAQNQTTTKHLKVTDTHTGEVRYYSSQAVFAREHNTQSSFIYRCMKAGKPYKHYILERVTTIPEGSTEEIDTSGSAQPSLEVMR